MKVINVVNTASAWRSREKYLIRKAQVHQLPAEKPGLTKRESEIIWLMFNDYNTFQIAEKLNISTKTVDTHRKNMLKKTGIHNPIGLIRYALIHGFLQLD